MANCRILNAGRVLSRVFVGKNVKIRDNMLKPLGNRFVVGDNSDIVL